MYCSDADELNQHQPGAPFQTAIEPLLLKYSVDMTITGHMHVYVAPLQQHSGERALPGF